MISPAQRTPSSPSTTPEGREHPARRSASLRFEALGPLVVRAGSDPVALPPAQRRLLASLLLSAGTPQATDALIDQMWGESPPRTAAQAIHVHLSALRRRLPGAIEARGGGYAVDLERHEFDVTEFTAMALSADEHLVAGRILDAAETASGASQLWRGAPYIELTDVEAARGERARLLERWVATRTTEARALTLLGRASEAIAALRHLVTDEPLNETLWEELVLAYCAAGRVAEARAALATARTTLHDELEALPNLRLQELERRVEDHDPALISTSATAVPHNLPLIDSSFVGRDDDVAAIVDLVARNHLVTITGPPGIGKTRLAVEVSSRLLERHTAGVWLVRLAGSRARTHVVSTITTAMAVTERVGDIAHLYRLLAPRPMLLVLDNCEHVLDAVRDLLADRRHGDRLRVLATSRSAIEIEGEAVWSLRPIALPTDADSLWESATLRMLADRVAEHDPRIALDRTDPSALMELCRRTGGMPLAVELMARRVATLDPERVVRLRLVAATGDPAEELPLEASVTRAIARSVRLLDVVDRRRFETASVFGSPFTFESFNAVCMPNRDAGHARAVVRRLCEASLLATERGSSNGVRYRMLEPLRDYGLQRLAASRRTAAVRDRHADWFADAARRVAGASWTDAEADALDDAEASIADHRDAMRHCIDTGRAHVAAEIAAGLLQFWISRFLAWEGQLWLDECLAAEMDDADRLPVLVAASGVAFFLGRYDTSEALCDEVLAIARRHGDRRREAQALYGKGRVRIHRQPDEGRALVEAAIDLYEAIGDRVTAAECRVVIGMQAAYGADRRSAEALLADSTAFLEAEGYPRIAAVGHRHLSMAAWHEHDEDAARKHLRAAMALADRANDRRVRSGALTQKGMVEARWGEPSAAAAALVESLKLVAGQNGIYFSLVAFGALELLVRRQSWTIAAQLLSHFDAVHAEYRWIPLDQRNAAAPVYRRRVAEGLAATGERPDLFPVPTAVMADRLVAELKVIGGQVAEA